jgi:PKD repeat protein
MNKLKTLKWTSLMTAIAFVIFSCSSSDDNAPKGPAPVAKFSSGTSADNYLTINFTNSSENAKTYDWDFGDGSTSTDENPSHTYAATGDYSVRLKATGDGGENSVTVTRTVKMQLTTTALDGGSSKSWVIKPAAGAFGVGPAIGSDAWWPNGANVAPDRPCLFNDEFIFKTDNVYQYETNGDIWAEAYMGYGDADKDQCQDDTTLPDNAKAWGSGTHTYTFTPETNGSTPQLAVTGTGAFIALPKAENGAEYAAAPPTADATVTYDIVSYTKDGDAETLVITVGIESGGYWTFTLVPKPL